MSYNVFLHQGVFFFDNSLGLIVTVINVMYDKMT